MASQATPDNVSPQKRKALYGVHFAQPLPTASLNPCVRGVRSVGGRLLIHQIFQVAKMEDVGITIGQYKNPY